MTHDAPSSAPVFDPADYPPSAGDIMALEFGHPSAAVTMPEAFRELHGDQAFEEAERASAVGPAIVVREAAAAATPDADEAKAIARAIVAGGAPAAPVEPAAPIEPTVEPQVEDTCEDILEAMGERPRYFFVEDEQGADWALNLLLTKAEQLKRRKAQLAAIIEAEEKDLDRLKARFVPQIEAWHRANPLKKGKTRKLLAGDIGTKEVAGSWSVPDKKAAIAYARANGHADLVKEKPVDYDLDLDAFKKLAAAHREATRIVDHENGEIVSFGELLPGVAFRESEDRFFIKGLD
jgi:hypothetical protein